jgi:hypothetical protein
MPFRRDLAGSLMEQSTAATIVPRIFEIGGKYGFVLQPEQH